jgi:hypothetical protein
MAAPTFSWPSLASAGATRGLRMASMPLDTTVEIEMIVEIDDGR